MDTPRETSQAASSLVFYRPHRGSLEDSLREVIEVTSLDQLVRHMRREVKTHNVYRWAADLISEVAEVRVESPEHALVTTVH